MRGISGSTGQEDGKAPSTLYEDSADRGLGRVRWMRAEAGALHPTVELAKAASPVRWMRAGCQEEGRKAMNEPRKYPAADAWHDAMYVGMDPKLRGRKGHAQHQRGDWWQYVYHVRGRHYGIEVHRTEIDLVVGSI